MKKRIVLLAVALTIATLLSACNQHPPETERVPEVVLQEETEHFDLYCDESDVSVLDDIIRILEDNYERILSDLQVQLDTKTDIYIYPDLENFHNAINQPNAPDWMVGKVSSSTKIKMVSPNNPGPQHDYDSIIQVALHEFVHIVADRVSENTPPAYLSEGLATYMAGQNQGVSYTVSSALKNGEFPSINELQSMSSDAGLYQFGYSFVEYIVTEYGYDKLLRIYKEPHKMESLLEISKDDLQANWIEHIKTVYNAG